jgi:probable phosphoglycerate mutase
VDLILIRHGLPLRIENEDGVPADPPLSETGQQQARQLAAWLEREHIDHVYASPLRRAYQTAEPLARAHGREITVEPGVVEFDPEAPSYVPMEELKANDYPRWLELVQGGFAAELDLIAFQKTVVQALEGIIGSHPGGRVAVVCHGGVINAWAGHVLGVTTALFFDPTYTSINRFLAARSGERMMVSLNEAAHLR